MILGEWNNKAEDKEHGQELLIYCSSDSSHEQPEEKREERLFQGMWLWSFSKIMVKFATFSFQFERTKNESEVVADSDEDMTWFMIMNHSNQPRMNWPVLLIVIPGRVAM